jgi:hypothetical protein
VQNKIVVSKLDFELIKFFIVFYVTNWDHFVLVSCQLKKEGNFRFKNRHIFRLIYISKVIGAAFPTLTVRARGVRRIPVEAMEISKYPVVAP